MSVIEFGHDRVLVATLSPVLVTAPVSHMLWMQCCPQNTITRTCAHEIVLCFHTDVQGSAVAMLYYYHD